MLPGTTNSVTLAPAAGTAAYALTLPVGLGTAGSVLKDTTGAGALAWADAGDVAGPSSSTATALPRFADNTGKVLAASGVLLDASNNLTGVARITVSDTATGIATPVGVSDAASKAYVDSATSGLKWKSPVRVATTANISLANTQTIVATISGNQTANVVYLLRRSRHEQQHDAHLSLTDG